MEMKNLIKMKEDNLQEARQLIRSKLGLPPDSKKEKNIPQEPIKEKLNKIKSNEIRNKQKIEDITNNDVDSDEVFKPNAETNMFGNKGISHAGPVIDEEIKLESKLGNKESAINKDVSKIIKYQYVIYGGIAILIVSLMLGYAWLCYHRKSQ